MSTPLTFSQDFANGDWMGLWTTLGFTFIPSFYGGSLALRAHDQIKQKVMWYVINKLKEQDPKKQIDMDAVKRIVCEHMGAYMSPTLFAVMWFTVYTLFGVAGFLSLRMSLTNNTNWQAALATWTAMTVFGALWATMFFSGRRIWIITSMVSAVIMFGCAITALAMFFITSPTEVTSQPGWLMVGGIFAMLVFGLMAMSWNYRSEHFNYDDGEEIQAKVSSSEPEQKKVSKMTVVEMQGLLDERRAEEAESHKGKKHKEQKDNK